MTYRYHANGFYYDGTGFFRLDRDGGAAIKCDPKAGTIPCGDTCRLPANCKETKGFGQGADREKVRQSEEQQFGNRLKAMGSSVAKRVADPKFREHLVSEFAENVGGALIARVAESHGIDPNLAEMAGNVIAKTVTGTAMRVFAEKERDPAKLAVGLAADLGSALAGQMIPEDADRLVHQGVSKMVGTAVTQAGRKITRTDALTESDLETLLMLAILGLSVRRKYAKKGEMP